MRPFARLARHRLTYVLEWLREMREPIKLPPRQEQIRINFSFHVEDIASTETYIAFREFIKRLTNLAQARPLLCVTTPQCPHTRFQMELHHLCEEEYEERVKELSKLAEIGYHGHFFSKGKGIISNPQEEGANNVVHSVQWPEGMNPMGSANFSGAIVEEQMQREIAWLRRIGIEPFAYVAGWWFMNEEVAMLLEENGIRVDSSLRQKHADTFGGGYLRNMPIPRRGEPFVLPPTKTVVEIQSIFYPVVHPRKSREFFRGTVEHKPDSPLYVVFPSHESEAILFEKELMNNVFAIRRMKDIFKWMDVSEQLAETSQALGLAG